MVVPVDVVDELDRPYDLGDAALKAWLDDAGPGAVNDVCAEGHTPLQRSMSLYGDIDPDHVELARFLISRGADVNLTGPDDYAPLHFACYYPLGPHSAEMVSLLLQAGASVNARTGSHGYPSHCTPLGILLNAVSQAEMSSFREIFVALLRAGASPDRCEGELSVEEVLNEDHGYIYSDVGDDEDFIKCQEILAGVREHGSYKRYARAPHREFLRFRSLLVRGRAKTNSLNERIARLPNGACWKVLSYWREDN